jgi:2-iminobutanoate/2-iminopropanoate deaminase
MVSTQMVKIGPGEDKDQRTTQAVLAGDFMYLSGQYPKDLVTGKIISSDIKDQIRAIFFNISKILSAQSLTLVNVVRITAYLKSELDLPILESALKTYFDLRRPALTAVFVDRFIEKEARLCLEAIAYVERD